MTVPAARSKSSGGRCSLVYAISCAETCLGRIEPESKIFFGVVFILVCRLVMVGVGAPYDARHPLVFAHAYRGDHVLKSYRIGTGHIVSDRCRELRELFVRDD